MKTLWSLRYVVTVLVGSVLAVTILWAEVTQNPKEVAFFAVALVGLLLAIRWRYRVLSEHRGWRIRHMGGGFAYEEKHLGEWKAIEFEWQDPREFKAFVLRDSLPAWAEDRRTEIIERVCVQIGSSEYLEKEQGA